MKCNVPYINFTTNSAFYMSSRGYVCLSAIYACYVHQMFAKTLKMHSKEYIMLKRLQVARCNQRKIQIFSPITKIMLQF